MKITIPLVILGFLVSARVLAQVQATPIPGYTPPATRLMAVPSIPVFSGPPEISGTSFPIPRSISSPAPTPVETPVPARLGSDGKPIYMFAPVTITAYRKTTPVNYVELNQFLFKTCAVRSPTPTGAEQDLAGAYDVYQKTSFGLAILQLLGIIVHK